MSSVFIVGAGRSGTTSILELLNLSRKTYCLSEPEPNLNIESRNKNDGQVLNVYNILHETVGKRISEGLSKADIYIEKQISLVPFIPDLFKLYNCKFVIPFRDGRDVVASLINWNQMMFPIIYSECNEQVNYSEHAKSILDSLKGQDSFDYSLPRPCTCDPYYESWKSFSRFEMATWYWGAVYRKIWKQLEKVDRSYFLFVDYRNPNADTIKELYDFIGLDDFNKIGVDLILRKKMNTLNYRGSKPGDFPYHANWDKEKQERFLDFNLDVMKRLGMLEGPVRKEPYEYGRWWHEESQVDPAWYKDLYKYREGSHEQFINFLHCSELHKKINRVIDVGSGIGYKYKDVFNSQEYIGIDLSNRVVAYANETNKNQQHRYICADIFKDQLKIKADMVTCHATIDNVYDIDAFLERLAELTNRYLYITTYRGYFRNLYPHRIYRDAKMGVNFNDISPRAVKEILINKGFKHIEIFPIKTFREDISVETVIGASKHNEKKSFFATGHKVYDEYTDYSTVEEEKYDEKSLLSIFSKNKEAFIKKYPTMICDIGRLSYLIKNLQKSGRIFGGSNEHLSGISNTLARVDIDVDISTAIDISKSFSQYGLKGIFYICHSSSYYGGLANGKFRRNHSLLNLIKAIQAEGQEIGLHVDPYFFYMQHGINGAKAVESEIKWLRDNYIELSSVTGHNAAAFYGAESIEIFSEYVINSNKWCEKKHFWMPKGILSAKELGIRFDGSKIKPPSVDEDSTLNQEYMNGPEGEFVIQNKTWMKLYLQFGGYCRWGWDYNCWLIGDDSWIFATGNDNGIFEYGITTKEVVDIISEISSEETLSITIHPLYVGNNKRDSVISRYNQEQLIKERSIFNGIKERIKLLLYG